MREQLICPAKNADIFRLFQDLYVRYKLDCFYNKLRSSISNHGNYISYSFFFIALANTYSSFLVWCCALAFKHLGCNT